MLVADDVRAKPRRRHAVSWTPKVPIGFVEPHFATLEEIGFREKNRYFTHPETQHIIEFPSGPLSVGGEAVKNITEIKYATGILRVISPTDCVKDRLAAYYFWKDQQSFNQALLVAQNNPVNISEIKKWSQAEGYLEEFKKFLNQYEDKK